jgi:glycosyltransferase involved in cell wall biosynthesis
MPDWDLPPAAFDHEATLEHADVVLLTGNRHTLKTFPERWRPKIRLLNYGLDERLWANLPVPALEHTHPEFVFVATDCGLRKGFLDVLATWREIQPDEARLHVIGRLEPPYDRLLEEANTGSIAAHGWVDSRSARYRELLGSCRFAYIPTWAEGQMGTLLEAVFAGCIPITTRASGAHEEVLRHCVIVEPGRPEQHRAAIREVLTWSAQARAARRDRLLKAARRRQNWNVFRVTVRQAIELLLRETAGAS